MPLGKCTECGNLAKLHKKNCPDCGGKIFSDVTLLMHEELESCGPKAGLFARNKALLEAGGDVEAAAVILRSRGYEEPKESKESDDQLGEILNQIAALGDTDQFGTRKEIKYLPNILESDEIILGLTSGFMNKNTWLIVCTNNRVIFLDKGMVYGLSQEEVLLQNITSISHNLGMIFGKIKIHSSSHVLEVENIEKKQVSKFVKAVNDARASLNDARKPPRVSANNDTAEIVSQIEKLGELLERGLLTDDEFNEQKAKVLSGN